MADRVVMNVPICFFFFQAEDGIRDSSVTGVQTCALPISRALGQSGVSSRGPLRAVWSDDDAAAPESVPGGPSGLRGAGPGRHLSGSRRFEIGRASCRERV